jgi:hypothetical protein
VDQPDPAKRNVYERSAARPDGEINRCADVLGENPRYAGSAEENERLGYLVDEDSDYNGGTPHHKDPFYFIEVRLPAGRSDTLTKQHMIKDFTKIIMLAEGNPDDPEDANRAWVTILEIQRDDCRGQLFENSMKEPCISSRI